MSVASPNGHRRAKSMGGLGSGRQILRSLDDESIAGVPFGAKPPWQPDERANSCTQCASGFSMFNRRHHCRGCGFIYCEECSRYRFIMPAEYGYGPGKESRLCFSCFSKLSDQSRPREDDTVKANYYLREQPYLKFLLSLTELGCRGAPLKSFVQVEGTDPVKGSKAKLLMSMMTPPSTSAVKFTADVRRNIRGILVDEIRHPNILHTLKVDWTDDKRLVVFRPFCSEGAMRDRMHNTSPLAAGYKRRFRGKGRVIGVKTIAICCRHVLEALKYLRSIGFPFPHLHAGNVVFFKNRWCITELENTFMGVTPRILCTSSKPEVECFGYFLHEMATGVPHRRNKPLSAAAQSSCHPLLRHVLVRIFDDERGVPNIDELLDYELFKRVRYPFPDAELPEFDVKQKNLVTIVRRSTRQLLKELAAAQSEFVSDDEPDEFDGEPDANGGGQEGGDGESGSGATSPNFGSPDSEVYVQPVLVATLANRDPLANQARRAEHLRQKRKQQRRLKRNKSSSSVRSLGTRDSSPMSVERSRSPAPSRDPPSASSAPTAPPPPAAPKPPPSAPAPPPPAPGPPPPKPPPSGPAPKLAAPAPQKGRASLLDSIRKAGGGGLKLKKVKPPR